MFMLLHESLSSLQGFITVGLADLVPQTPLKRGERGKGLFILFHFPLS